MGINVETLAAAKKYADKIAGSSGGGGAVEVIEDSSASYAKVYTIKQDGNVVGTINIPKDMVVQSGQIVENPSGQTAGKYLELTLANSDNSKVYISVSDLTDVYTIQEKAAQVQLAINESNQISATIVNGSIGTQQLSTTITNTLNIASVHVSTTIPSEAGAHGLRYCNNTLQYYNGTKWVTLSMSNLLL